jgi:hypothetical protein
LQHEGRERQQQLGSSVAEVVRLFEQSAASAALFSLRSTGEKFSKTIPERRET